MSKLEKLQPDATVKYISADSTRRKLPGTGFRILSFIPVFNWISLLYLGLINSSTLNVMCAIAYAFITFTNSSLSALIWTLGIVHYAGAYQIVKKQIIGDAKKPTLPGKGCRILSFLPSINWVSLLYIGLINSSILDVIFAVAYAVIAFTDTSFLAILIWILGIVHYEIAYRKVKTQIIGDAVKSTTQTKTTPIHNSTSISNGFSEIAVPGEQEFKQSISVMPSSALEGVKGDVSPKSTSAASELPNVVASKEQEYKNRFSDIVVPGEQESKQSIPVKPSYASEGVSFSVSMQNPHTKFFTDMERNASREGKTAAFVPFMSYWPTYDSMNKAQQEWYFYWRSQIRQEKYMDTDLSYIFVLIYEILSGIGWRDPQEGYQKLMQLWAAYRKKFPSLDHYLTGWTFDFAQQYNLEYRLSDVAEYPRLAPSVMTDILIAKHAEDVPLKLHFSLIDALSDYSLVNSKFYKDGNQDLMHEAIPRVIALADAALRKNTQKGILDTYGPSSIKKQEYYAFTSAVCSQANKKISVTVKDYSTYPNLRAYIKELVRYGENTLRELRGYQGRLRGVTIDEETIKLVKNFLEKEYGQQATQENESSKPKPIIDHEKIIAITIESKEVTIALDPTNLDPTIPEKKELLTDIQEVTAICTAISPSARSLLDLLDKSTWECGVAQGDELLIAEINRLAERYLGRSLLVSEASKIIVEDDYRDELEYIYKNQPATLSGRNGSKLFDPSKLTSGTMKNFVNALEPVQQRALYVLITSENPQSDLERIAEEELTMPQLLLDDINALALQTIEEIIVDTIDEKPRILDEYMDLLKQSVVQERK